MRFRIDIGQTDDGWEAVIYDLADHGPDMPYAKVWNRNIDVVMRHVAPYVASAAADHPDELLASLLKRAAVASGKERVGDD